MSMPNSSTRKQRTNIEEKKQSAAFSVYSAAFSCHVEVRGFQMESCLEPPHFEAIWKLANGKYEGCVCVISNDNVPSIFGTP